VPGELYSLQIQGAASRTVKIEYQMSRSVFVGPVTELDSEAHDALRDDTRTELPIVIRDRGAGAYLPALGFRRPTLQADWLFSYEPVPGTVVFAGYGTTLSSPPASRDRLMRARDGSSSRSATCSGCEATCAACGKRRPEGPPYIRYISRV
jgi:hypothetical protein